MVRDWEKLDKSSLLLSFFSFEVCIFIFLLGQRTLLVYTCSGSLVKRNDTNKNSSKRNKPW